MFPNVTASAAFPALSVQGTLLVTDPLPVSVVWLPLDEYGAGKPDGPASAHAKLTVTSLFVQLPAVYAAPPEVALAVITGLLTSILIVTLLSVLTLPALSVHVPFTSVPAVSVLIVLPLLPLAIPLRASVPAVKLTVTGPLFQPAALAAGDAPAVGAVGGVLSSLMFANVTASAAFPALSVQGTLLV